MVKIVGLTNKSVPSPLYYWGIDAQLEKLDAYVSDIATMEYLIND